MITYTAKVDTARYLAYIEGMAGKMANPGDVLASAMRKAAKEIKENLKEEAISKYTVGADRFAQGLSDSGKSSGGWVYLLKFTSKRPIGFIRFEHSPQGLFTTGNRPTAVMGHRLAESSSHVIENDAGNKAFTTTLRGNTHLAARIGGNRSSLETQYGPSSVQMVQKALKDGSVDEQAKELLEAAIEKALAQIMR